MAILVTGGAGYIGSVTVAALLAGGEQPVVLDNLVYGHREAIPGEVPFYEGDIGDSDLVGKIAAEHDITACMHFSAYAYVGESVEEPSKYFNNNVVQTIALLDKLVELGIRQFVFSSTCATYGEPRYTPIDEQHPQLPTNPYGWTKLMAEQALRAYDKAYGLRFGALRYFNACGAAGDLGEDHDPETHLIPLVLAAAAGKIPEVSIFGDDYPTPDGTAVRDYIHVSDLADAHILALRYLESGGDSDVFNLGNGNGYSVNEVIEAARRVTGKPVPATVAARRAGDPSKLVADAQKARSVLGWEPRFPELESIIETAWAWHSANPDGYRSA